VKALKIAGIGVVVLCVAWVAWHLGELQRLGVTACSHARQANVVLEAEHGHPKTVFSSSGCDYGYMLWWFSPHQADRKTGSH